MSRRFFWPIMVATASLTVVAITGCGSTTPSAEAFCERLETLGEFSITLIGDPDVLATAAQDLNDLAAVAPAEVQPSVEVLSAALTTMSQAAAQAGDDPSASLDAALGALAPIIDDVDQASATMESYAATNCDISLLDDTSTTVQTQ